MKENKLLQLLSIFTLVCVFTFANASAGEKHPAQKKGETTTLFSVKMDCHKCVEEIEKNIAWEKGVTDLKCDLNAQTVEVSYKVAKTSDANIIKAFKKINKDAAVLKTDIKAVKQLDTPKSE